MSKKVERLPKFKGVSPDKPRTMEVEFSTFSDKRRYLEVIENYSKAGHTMTFSQIMQSVCINTTTD